MPIYEYEYKKSGKAIRVERLYPMGKAPATITVKDAGRSYTASRVISAHAPHGSWNTYEPGDLPPVDWSNNG